MVRGVAPRPMHPFVLTCVLSTHERGPGGETRGRRAFPRVHRMCVPGGRRVGCGDVAGRSESRARVCAADRRSADDGGLAARGRCGYLSGHAHRDPEQCRVHRRRGELCDGRRDRDRRRQRLPTRQRCAHDPGRVDDRHHHGPDRRRHDRRGLRNLRGEADESGGRDAGERARGDPDPQRRLTQCVDGAGKGRRGRHRGLRAQARTALLPADLGQRRDE